MKRTLATTDGEKVIYNNRKCQIDMYVYDRKGEHAYTITNFKNFKSVMNFYNGIKELGYKTPTLLIGGSQIIGF